jgi:hypothetical protein
MLRFSFHFCLAEEDQDVRERVLRELVVVVFA